MRHFTERALSIPRVVSGFTVLPLVAFGKALDQYRPDSSHYLTLQQGVANPANEAKRDVPYRQKTAPRDPWGNAYMYEICTRSTGSKVYSICTPMARMTKPEAKRRISTADIRGRRH